MDWVDLQTGLPALITTLLGGVPCQWRTQPRQMITSASTGGVTTLLDILNLDTVGDERVWVGTVDLETEESTLLETESEELLFTETGFVETIYGLREMTIQVTAWTLHEQIGTSERSYLERLRTRLRLTSSQAALSELGLAIVNIESVVQTQTVENNRYIAQASLDIRFAYGVAESDDPAPFIETVHAFSESLRDAGGTPEPAGLQIDQTIPEP
jgi:hypothetical protein